VRVLLSNSSVDWSCPRKARIRKCAVSGTNVKIKHVLQSSVSPILLLYFVRISGTVTGAVIGSSIPWFQSVNTFQARKRMSFHRQDPRRSKFMSRKLRAVVEEREFFGKWGFIIKLILFYLFKGRTILFLRGGGVRQIRKIIPVQLL